MNDIRVPFFAKLYLSFSPEPNELRSTEGVDPSTSPSGDKFSSPPLFSSAVNAFHGIDKAPALTALGDGLPAVSTVVRDYSVSKRGMFPKD